MQNIVKIIAIPLRYAGIFASMVLLLTACGGGNSSPNFSSSSPPATAPPAANPDALETRNRYSFNDACVVLLDRSSGNYLAGEGSYSSSAADIADAAAFYLKPSALGKYLLYNTQRNLLQASGGNVTTISLADAVPDDTDPAHSHPAEWTVVGRGDTVDYPAAPLVDTEPDPANVAAYRNFNDPNSEHEEFTLTADAVGMGMALNAAGELITSAQPSPFEFVQVNDDACQQFPEAQTGASGVPFKGVQSSGPLQGSVLGMADVHVHITSTTYLSEVKSSWPFHKFGVTHAVGNCDDWHGPNGTTSPVASAFGGNAGNHDTTGFPFFSQWPARGQLTHEAIYWKWLERAWYGGLRLVVNDAVENETLCKIQRNAINEPNRDCDPMKSARRQMGSMYAMQDYIDAQFGGRGAGWFRIVHSPAEARTVIADGNMAVVIGMEISNTFGCKLTYNPARGDESGNGYDCSMAETGAANEIKTQLDHLHEIGLRQMFTVHEFDNAFAGNGIFEGTIFNLGNKENSGGISQADVGRENVDAATSALPGPLGEQVQVGTALFQPAVVDSATGEFWTTYDCPADDDPKVDGGYIFGPGALVPPIGPPRPGCQYSGQRQDDGARSMPGGVQACFPITTSQCNARWLTDIGLYAYEQIMRKGIIFELDHLELEVKSQVLEIGAAQTPNYPAVSVHGGHGGISIAQAKQIYQVGGILYPGLNNGPGHIGWLERLRPIHAASGTSFPFATGFGTDTNGLSGQANPRGSIEDGKAVVYPYTLFDGPLFDQMPEFSNATPVVFEQPEARDPDGNGRNWHIDQDGHAHYGMLSGTVEELRLEGSEQDMRDMFNSAEMYLRTWERTLQARDGILQNGFTVPDGLIRFAPNPDPTGF